VVGRPENKVFRLLASGRTGSRFCIWIDSGKGGASELCEQGIAAYRLGGRPDQVLPLLDPGGAEFRLDVHRSCARGSGMHHAFE
jgi:hypothetical protein